jgi:SCY1-like protein 2
MFSKTSSLGIKVRGLEALGVLCGASSEGEDVDAGLSEVLNDNMTSKAKSGTSLDKFTVQEKVVPLLRAIKTKEPAVMMAALGVFQQVGKTADTDFLATEVLPTLWSFSLGPLLNLRQFQAFMKLIKAVSLRIEQEQIKKLQELSSASADGAGSLRSRNDGSQTLAGANGTGTGADGDFERLVLGNRGSAQNSDPFETNWTDNSNAKATQSNARKAPNFSWASPDAPATGGVTSPGILSPQTMTSRSITPDYYNAFPSLEPTNKVTSPTFAPMQPSTTTPSNPNLVSGRPGTDSANSNPPLTGLTNARNTTGLPPFSRPMQPTPQSPYSILPPPSTSNNFSSAANPASFGSFSTAPPPPGSLANAPPKPQYGGGLGASTMTTSSFKTHTTPGPTNPPQKQGLDKYESLL